jgi:fermentation-respiration switch protein FrsA (DUF1100 family)
VSSRLQKFGATVAAVTILVYGGAVVYLKANETTLIYRPYILEEGRINAPAESLHVRPVTLNAADGSRVAAWVIPPSPTADSAAAMWILIDHGNAGNITLTKRQDFYARIRSMGVGILAYDYRGFGQSETRAITEAGVYADAQGAYDYLRKVLGVPPERIIIFGHSLGSGVAIELATHAEAAGLVVEGAYTAVDDVAAEQYPMFPVRAVMANHFRSIDRIATVSMPKLFMHATDDQVIPYAHGRKLFDTAKEPRQFVDLIGGHEDAYREDPRYLATFGGFVKRVAPGASVPAESGSPPKD